MVATPTSRLRAMGVETWKRQGVMEPRIPPPEGYRPEKNREGHEGPGLDGCPKGVGPNSDNHAHDEQNAWEKTLSTFCSVAAGNDLIVNCGMFATGMTCSHEQLFMDEAISAFSRRIAAGLRVDRKTIAAELIKERGPRGETYLTADHTLQWLRSEEYVRPRLTVSGSYATWKAAGAKDTYALAREAVQEARGLKAPPFDAARKARLGDVIGGFRE
jgi:trimethylamine:corrinoid methyltransferase-like protein